MPASDAMIAVKLSLEPAIFGLAGVTGIDIGMRDEESLDPDDLAVRIFVQDASQIPQEINDMLGQSPVPAVVMQRRFEPTATLPDTDPHRPVAGGTSVGAARFVNSPSGFPAGTLGAVGQTTRTPTPITVGLSNHHVLAHDSLRDFGQEIIQPEPGVLGRFPGDRIGSLLSWDFPEIVFSGTADAAICSIEVDTAAEIRDVGAVAGTTSEFPGMLVRKRGRTTGLTFGIVTTDNSHPSARGTYVSTCAHLPPVNNPLTGQPTIMRQLTGQFQVKVDFPQSIFFSDHGDSGSVVLDSDNNIIGLLHGSGYVDNNGALGPARFAVVTPIDVVQQNLGISMAATF